MHQPPPELQLCVGNDLQIMCGAVGRQPLMYQWFKESTILEAQTDKELAMKHVELENEGLYICRVSNIRGYQFSRWVRVVVEKSKLADSEDSGRTWCYHCIFENILLDIL